MSVLLFGCGNDGGNTPPQTECCTDLNGALPHKDIIGDTHKKIRYQFTTDEAGAYEIKLSDYHDGDGTISNASLGIELYSDSHFAVQNRIDRIEAINYTHERSLVAALEPKSTYYAEVSIASPTPIWYTLEVTRVGEGSVAHPKDLSVESRTEAKLGYAQAPESFYHFQVDQAGAYAIKTDNHSSDQQARLYLYRSPSFSGTWQPTSSQQGQRVDVSLETNTSYYLKVRNEEGFKPLEHDLLITQKGEGTAISPASLTVGESHLGRLSRSSENPNVYAFTPNSSGEHRVLVTNYANQVLNLELFHDATLESALCARLHNNQETTRRELECPLGGNHTYYLVVTNSSGDQDIELDLQITQTP